jgi:hypothetical protein
MKKLRVIIACEESQTVCKAFRKLGHEAYSCDLLPCSGGHPEWHIQGDIFTVLNPYNFFFNTQNGDLIETTYKKWDLMIGHPECTRLTVTANKWYKPEYADRFPTIHQDREEAVKFFMRLIEVDIPMIAIENPIGIMSTRYRKPDQVIHPYQFGDGVRKSTCLWLKNLPKLMPTNIVPHEIFTFKSGKTMSMEHYRTASLPKEERRKARSKTFQGIADAFASQWGGKIKY